MVLVGHNSQSTVVGSNCDTTLLSNVPQGITSPLGTVNGSIHPSPPATMRTHTRQSLRIATSSKQNELKANLPFHPVAHCTIHGMMTSMTACDVEASQCLRPFGV